MGAVKMILRKLEKHMVEGHLLRYIREQLDEAIFGRLGRWILKLRTPVVPNKVFFHTQENRYACNQKYICEEFRRRGLDVELVWRRSKKNRGGIPEDVRAVNEGTYEYFKEIMSSKYVIANSVLYVKKGFSLKKEQVLFQTWHGSLGIKRFGKKDYKGGWHWVRGAIATGKMTDYCVTNSTFVSGSLRNTYWPNTPMLEYGHPRNDLFFENYRTQREELRARLCQEWEVDPDTKFVMYGPTFRDDKQFDCYDIDFERLVDCLKQRFGSNWVVLLRYHPSLVSVYRSRGLKADEQTVRTINVTGYLDMQELIAVADVAITDYSSWIYDFMLLRRPGFIFATDIDLYNNERGFCYPLETTPFPIAVNNDQLAQGILNFDEEDYLAKLEAFLEDKGCIEDGHASERVVDKILELMEADKGR